MKAVYVTDIHINKYNNFADKSDRLEDCLRVIDDCYELAASHGAQHILMSGDMFDTVKYLLTEVINKTTARFARWIDAYPDITWYCITGNHDFGSKNLPDKPAISSIEFLTQAFPDNIVLLDNAYTVIGDAVVYGIPNYEFPEHYRQMLENATQLDVNYKGAKSKILMIHQKPPHKSNPLVKADTDPTDPLYDMFDLILCGDIHASEWVTDKFLLGGNPLHKDANDAGRDKGIWLLDLSDPLNTIKFVSRRGKYPEFIKVPAGEGVIDDNNFIIQQPEVDVKIDGLADAGAFSNNLPRRDLVANFVAEKGNDDPDLVDMGVRFVE
ncbi:MAG: metallophosphoesterase [Chitinophagales bacterium]|nr:metallophosphoesterase [Chitinophagales bacterium]